jgi:hypothetical protein
VPAFGSTQARRSAGLAVGQQAGLPLCGLLVAVGAVRQLAELPPGGGLEDLRKASSKGWPLSSDSASAWRASDSTTIYDTVCSALTPFSSP